jgi:hypothetical protein
VSTLKVDTITKADGTGSLSVPAESGTVVTTASPSLGRRNLIINGAMQVAQRSTSLSVSSSGYRALDRFYWAANTEDVITMSQASDGPDEFANSLKIEVTTAETDLAAGEYALLTQRIEGQNLQGIAKGTSSAKQLTASFWVKGSITGTYIVELFDNDNTRQVSASYTINSANTWEYKTITFPADTSGAFDNDNNGSLFVQFVITSGTDFTSGTLNTSWASSTNANRWVGQTNVIGTSGATFYITGVQLEVGTVATPFEHRSYGEELALCQRYYQKSYNLATAPGTASITSGQIAILSNNSSYGEFFQIRFPVAMRTSPTATTYNPSTGSSGSIRNLTASSNVSANITGLGENGFSNLTAALTSGSVYTLQYTMDAEL